MNYKIKTSFALRAAGYVGLVAGVLGFILIFASLGGCVQRIAHFPKPSLPIRLAEPLKGVKVYVKNTKGELVEATADLYPGLWIFVDPKEWDSAAKAKALNLVKVAKDK